MSISAVRQKVINSRKLNKGIFVTKYNPLGPNICGILRRHSKLLQSDSVKAVLPEGVMVVYKREKNLKELLTRADPYSIKTVDSVGHGYTPCGKKCDSCQNFVSKTDRITSNATGKTFFIRRALTCGTKNVIYCATCNKCKQQNVGSTVDWKPRLGNYKSHI